MCEQPKNRLGKSTFGIGLSLLCAVHCLATPVLVALIPVAGHSILHNPLIEFGLLAISVVFAGSILLKDRKLHGNNKPISLAVAAFLMMLTTQIFHLHSIIYSLSGALMLILAYILNWRAFHTPVLKN